MAASPDNAHFYDPANIERFRTSVGLPSGAAVIEDSLADHSRYSNLDWGVPLTRAEAAELWRRNELQTGSDKAVDYALAQADFSGMYWDQKNGGTGIFKFTGDLKKHEAAIVSRVPQGQVVEVTKAPPSSLQRASGRQNRGESHMISRALSVGSFLALSSALAIATPTPATSPLVLDRSVSSEVDGLRLSMSIDGNPLVAGRPAWIRTRIENTGKQDIVWEDGGCDAAVIVSARMTENEWRPSSGDHASGAISRFAATLENAVLDEDPTVQLEIEPKDAIGTGGYGCSDVRQSHRLAPGDAITERHRWDGFAQWQLGLPPVGTATISGILDDFERAGTGGRPTESLSVTLDALVVGGLPAEAPQPLEIMDIALADPAFGALVEDGLDGEPLLQYRKDLGLWQVGYLVRGARLVVALVDPSARTVVAIIDRPWIKGEDAPVDSQ